MFFFWGRKIARRTLGYVADFCPVCAGVSAGELHRLVSTVHLCYMGLRRGQLLGYQRTCLVCKTADWVDLHRYASVAKSNPALLQHLIEQTLPNIQTVEAKRVALQTKTRQTPQRLSALLTHLHDDSTVQGGATIYLGNQLPIVVTATPRQHLNTVLGLLILGAIGAVIWPFISGPQEMTQYCKSVPLGSTYEQVKAHASAQGYRVTALSDGGAYLYSERSMGRFGCDLKFAGVALLSASYQLND